MTGMNDTTGNYDAKERIGASLRGLAREIDFVVMDSDSSNQGLAVLLNSTPILEALCDEAQQLGIDDLCQFRDAAQRGEAFLAQHGHSSQ
jgi:hypothetical protein